MRILFVTEGIPVPPCGGHLLRTYHQMRILAQQHHVDIVALAEPSRSNTSDFNLEFYRAKLAEFCKYVTLVSAPSGNKWNKLINYASPLPSNAIKLARSGLPQTVSQQLRRFKYDAVIFLLSDTGLCLPKGYDGYAIIDMVDLFSVSFKYYSNIAKTSSAKLRRRFDSIRYANYERLVSKRFNKILLVAEADIQQYPDAIKKLSAEVDWVPHGIDTTSFSRPNGQVVDNRSILISGALNHPANVQGIEYFCEEVFPHVIQTLPDAKLSIVGSKPPNSIMKLVSDRVRIYPNVPDIKPYLFQAAVSFCGVKLRMGTQTKILEAMAAGVPVVSTEEGNNGIAGVNGRHLFFSQDPKQLAQSIVQLCTNESLWRSLSQTAKDYVSNKFTWSNSATKLQAIIEEGQR